MTNRAQIDNSTALITIIRGLTSGSRRSLAGQIREAFDEIEAKIAEGYSLKVITETLNANGVRVTYKYMKNLRLRIRNERKKAKIREPTTRPTVVPRSVNSETTVFTRNTGRNPEELF